MDIAEKTKPVSRTAPAPIAKSVLAHRRIIEAERDALKTGAAELALKSVGGDLEARAALAAIPGKTAALQREIDWNHAAHELAIKHDSDAEIAWRASLLTGGAPYAGSTCLHPVRYGTLHQFNVDMTGRRIFPHRGHPRASQVFDAATTKLKVREKFSNE